MSTPKKPAKELKQTALRIPADKHRELKILAARLGTSLHSLLVEGIDHVLAKYGKGK
jgi:predicted HicB family RNase H-like nuclease